MKQAHRVAWQDSNGIIPPGLWVLHKCDNPRCCNPNHLYLGTIIENTLDMVTRKRWRNGGYHGEQLPQSKLTATQVRAIRNTYAEGGQSQRQLAETYGVSGAAICLILSRQRWKHV